MEYWDDVDREQVDKLPEGIDGVRVFVIKNLDGKKTIEALKDGCQWKKKLSHALARAPKDQICGLQNFAFSMGSGSDVGALLP